MKMSGISQKLKRVVSNQQELQNINSVSKHRKQTKEQSFELVPLNLIRDRNSMVYAKQFMETIDDLNTYLVIRGK
jgi:hypothetical protein